MSISRLSRIHRGRRARVSLTAVAAACGSDSDSSTSRRRRRRPPTRRRRARQRRRDARARPARAADRRARVDLRVAHRAGADRGRRDQRGRRRQREAGRRSPSPTTAAATTRRWPTQSLEHAARRRTRSTRSSGPTASGTALDLLEPIRPSRRRSSARARTPPPELSTARLRRLLLPHRAARPAAGDRARPAAGARAGKRRPVIVVRDDAYGNAFVGPAARGAARAADATPAGRSSATTPTPRTSPRSARGSPARKPDSVVAISLADDGARAREGDDRRRRRPEPAPDVHPGRHAEHDVRARRSTRRTPALVQGILGTAPAAAPAGIARPVHRRAAPRRRARRSSPRTTTTARSSPRSPRCRRSRTTRRR